jgi:L-alanine-DL-glutamate epimerase-like enolase superfamily enzyme
MKIARVEARALRPRVPIKAPGIDREATRQLIYVEIETEGGPVGYGIGSLAPPEAVVPVINNLCAPLIKGMDARAISAVWNALYRELAHRGQTGLAYHAISAIDIALWDIRGKALGEPVWRLLGGARDRVRCYVTFGLPSFDMDQLVAVAKHWVGQGFGGLKMVVGVIARDKSDAFVNSADALREDARRLKAVREAVGDKVEIAVDINCELDPSQALSLAHMLAPYDPAFIEEPVSDNDARAMADFKAGSPVQVATGQSLGALYRFADILSHRAADILQPNVVNCGGFTGGLRAADMALGFNVPICNGGGATAHNLHLQAGCINGTACEWHPYMSMGATAAIFNGCPQPEDGWLVAPETPGVGLTPDPDALREFG